MSYYYPRAAVKLRILPEDFQLSSDPTLQQVLEIIVQAKNVTVTVNDYKTTDTFSMDIDYKSFPFDPRTIRSCGVTIYMQDMERQEKDDGTINTLVPGAATKLNANLTNAVYSGFVDEETISFDESKREVHFDGRDFTALLIDQKYKVNAPISFNSRLDVALTTLLAGFSATSQIKVVNKTKDANGNTIALPIIASYDPAFGAPMTGMKNVGAKESYWEIIQDMVNRAGLICFVHLDQLILTTPKNQSDNTDDIKFIYGQNVKSLTFKRKLGRFKGFNIQVRSRVGKRVLTAKIPEEATAAWAAAFGVSRDPVRLPTLRPDGSLDPNTQNFAPYITFPVPNIGNKDQLIRIGQTLYEQYSLQQLEGSFETLEMLGRGQTKDTTGDTRQSFTQYDLTQISKGQSIVLEIDTDDLAEISRLKDVPSREQYLIRRNYDRNVAAIFAKTMGKFSPRFQIKSYTMTMNNTDGWKLKVDFQNIIDLTQRSQP